MESKIFDQIGSWWQAKQDDPCEVDIVAIYAERKRALVAEVKRKRKNFKLEDFKRKVEILRTKILSKYEIEPVLYCLEDM